MEPKSGIVSLSSVFKNKKVFIALLALIVLMVILLVLQSAGIIKSPFQNVPLLQKGPNVSVKEAYKNPFDKKTQYVNPFDTYKNPFVVAK